MSISLSTFRASDQTELFYRSMGPHAGKPLLLLHGFPFDSRLWNYVAPSLSAAGCVILPDLRGFGRSGRPAGPHTAERFAKDAVDLLDYLGVQDAYVGGHSMGGYAALAMAQLHPDRVAGLALLHSHPYADDQAARQNRYELARNIFGSDRQVWADVMMEKLTGPNFSGEEERRLVHDIFAAAEPRTIAACAVGMALRPSRVETWRSFEGPALFVSGKQDAMMPNSRAQAVRDLRKMKPLGSRSVSKSGSYAELDCGHAGMLERPREFVQAVLGWWK